jgi:hypothetical protein
MQRHVRRRFACSHFNPKAVKRTTVNQRVIGPTDFTQSWHSPPLIRRAQQTFQGFDNVKIYSITQEGRGDIHGRQPDRACGKTDDYKSEIAALDIDGCLCA